MQTCGGANAVSLFRPCGFGYGNCTGCNITLENQAGVCTTCASGRYLVQNQCLESCSASDGVLLNSTGSCEGKENTKERDTMEWSG